MLGYFVKLENTAVFSSQKSANYVIVGTDPLISPVPLDVLEHCNLIHRSDGGVLLPEIGRIPEVKIFEYVK